MKFLYWTGTKEVKELFSRVLSNLNLSQKSVLDFPAGSGFTSELLLKQKAKVTALDIFPDFFKVQGLECGQGDLSHRFPCDDNEFDVAVFQEGIEHLPDGLFALQEFHRVLKENGALYVTTPNYSNLRSRVSYLLFESETPKMMPPNEIESVWKSVSRSQIYFGHIFPTGIMKLRCLARLSGFELVRVHPSRVNWSSFGLMLFLWPWIFLVSLRNYARALRKNSEVEPQLKKKVFSEILKLNLNLTVLLGGHLIVEFRKVQEHERPESWNRKISVT